MGKKYNARKIESKIRQAVNQFPVTALTGPCQTGKTTTLKKLFPDAECYLLNLYEEELQLTYGTSLPYWEFPGILRQ